MGELKILETNLKSEEIIDSHIFVDFKASAQNCRFLIFFIFCKWLFDWGSIKWIFFQNRRIAKVERRGGG